MTNQEALDTIKDYLELTNSVGDDDNITRLNKVCLEKLQELLDSCVFLKDSWKIENNVKDTLLIETPTDRSIVPRVIDYE